MADGPTDPNAEPLDQNQPPGSPGFFGGNEKFITRKLWGLANAGPFGHAGKFTTMREAINLGHNGEATGSRRAFQALSSTQQEEGVCFFKPPKVWGQGEPCLAVKKHRNRINLNKNRR